MYLFYAPFIIFALGTYHGPLLPKLFYDYNNSRFRANSLRRNRSMYLDRAKSDRISFKVIERFWILRASRNALRKPWTELKEFNVDLHSRSKKPQSILSVGIELSKCQSASNVVKGTGSNVCTETWRVLNYLERLVFSDQRLSRIVAFSERNSAEYNFRNDAIRWKTSKSANVIFTFFLFSLKYDMCSRL